MEKASTWSRIQEVLAKLRRRAKRKETNPEDLEVAQNSSLAEDAVDEDDPVAKKEAENAGPKPKKDRLTVQQGLGLAITALTFAFLVSTLARGYGWPDWLELPELSLEDLWRPGVQPEEATSVLDLTVETPGTEEVEPVVPEPEQVAEVVKPTHKPEVANFVDPNDYRTAELNLGGVDINSDGILDGIAHTTSIENPTIEQIVGLQESAGERWNFELTQEDAMRALQDGGFVRDGRTYEIWAHNSHATEFFTTPVPEGHPLLSKGVVNLDALNAAG